MKKWICLSLVLVLVLLSLPGCDGLTAMMDQNTQSKAQVEQMLTALAEKNQEKAVGLMHPSVDSQDAQAACSQMSLFLSGRKATAITTTGMSFHNSVGPGGKTEQESASFQVELEDGTQIKITATYLKDSEGEGFTAFQLAIGLV